ncbi:hypothetical protein [Eubacterium callanderi]|uniref:hypothetical protein n=1 Tax=Eubacterium callanderi TaxID=53442 RepID=UPI003AEF543F
MAQPPLFFSTGLFGGVFGAFCGVLGGVGHAIQGVLRCVSYAPRRVFGRFAHVLGGIAGALGGVLYRVAGPFGRVFGGVAQVLPGVLHVLFGAAPGAVGAVSVVAVHTAGLVRVVSPVAPVLQGTSGVALPLDGPLLGSGVGASPAVGRRAGGFIAAGGERQAEGEDESGGHQFANHTFPPLLHFVKLRRKAVGVVCAKIKFLINHKKTKITTYLF